MNYSTINNTELALLGLIAEQGRVSGYELNRLIKQRGFDQWAGLGATSVYAALKKLAHKGLIELEFDLAKQGKGPPGKLAALTGPGFKALSAEVLAALALPRPPLGRFELALAALEAVEPSQALARLQMRLIALERDKDRLASIYQAQGGDNLSLSPQALFDHSFTAMGAGIDFTRRLIERLEQQTR